MMLPMYNAFSRQQVMQMKQINTSSWIANKGIQRLYFHRFTKGFYFIVVVITHVNERWWLLLGFFIANFFICTFYVSTFFICTLFMSTFFRCTNFIFNFARCCFIMWTYFRFSFYRCTSLLYSFFSSNFINGSFLRCNFFK
ncbi:hypothetical protein V8G54_023838 [Vigna mungo]|uniref:Uncharacterized protein n=1 Tax=Vigna mungo TaxID=3915 RepID=A0AAQ3RQQ5_VIGMU